MRLKSLAFSLFLTVAPIALFGATLSERLDGDIERLNAAIETINRNIDVPDSVETLGAAVQDIESLLADLREIRRETNAERQNIEESFFQQSQNLSQLLGLLISIENAPAPNFLLHPEGPLGAARAGHMMAELTPTLEAESRDLALRVKKWRELSRLESKITQTVSLALTEIKTARMEFVDAGKNRIGQKVEPLDPMQLDALYIASEDLETLSKEIAAINIETPTGASDITLRKGELSWPVTVTKVGKYPQTSSDGAARPGVALTTEPLAIVTSPFAATVRFAGEFLDYGNVIILEPSRGVLMVLAGLGEIAVAEGDVVESGASIGLAGGNAAEDAEIFLIPKDIESQDEKETLYIEMRVNGDAEDPRPWFARVST